MQRAQRRSIGDERADAGRNGYASFKKWAHLWQDQERNPTGYLYGTPLDPSLTGPGIQDAVAGFDWNPLDESLFDLEVPSMT